MEDELFRWGGLASIGAAFIAMLKLLARPDGRWAPLVERLEGEIEALRVENVRLKDENERLLRLVEEA